MKTLKTFFLGSLALLFVTACQNEEIDSQTVTPPQLVPGENEAIASFELDATAMPQELATRAFSPEYKRENFQIYAFKKSGTSFVYEKEMAIDDMKYNDTTKKLTGADVVEIGTYKFLPVYGINQGKIKKVDWTAQTDIETAILELNGQLEGEVFLPYNKNGNNPIYTNVLKEYNFKVDEKQSKNELVKDTLYRAVSRVDILFVSAKKQIVGTDTITVDTIYNGDKDDVLGTDLKNLKIEFTGVNNKMTYIGNPVISNPTTTNLTVNLGELKRDTGGKITIGTGTSTTSKMEESTYNTWDKIDPEHIVKKGAHVFGTYLFPNRNKNATTGVKLTIEGEGIGIPRIIKVPNIPLEQNKVTLIKIRAVRGLDGPTQPTVFETGVDFEVQVITAWNSGANIVVEEIN